MENIPKFDYHFFCNKCKKHDKKYDVYHNTVNSSHSAFFLTSLTYSHANLLEMVFFYILGKYRCSILRVLHNTFVPYEKYGFIKFKEHE